MLRLAREGHAMRNRHRRPFPLESAVPGFAEYLRCERGFKEITIYAYRRHLNEFAEYLSRAGVTSFSELSPPLLGAFIVERAPGMAPRTRRDLCGHLRVLLRFCHREGITNRDLSGAVGMSQVYRLDDVPRSITWDEVRRMLDAVERRTIRGRRDYAILLLLVTYGLRAHEVARLTLDDVDWKRERLQVLERKAGHATAYPLAKVVGEAVRRAGSHTLRHTCVQRLIDAEFPLKTIGDYVGHRSSQSTRIYTKVAIASLREVAMGDGEAL
jgi:site-specific recombinase XerD